MASLIKANTPGYDKSLDYNIYWANDRGDRIMEIEKVLSFSYVKAVQSIGPFEISIPYEKGFETGRDYQIQFWRKPYGSSVSRMDYFGFARTFGRKSSGGNAIMTIRGFDPMYLIDGRIIAYPTQSAEAAVTDNAGDIMKGAVRANISNDEDYGGSGLTPSRDMTGFTVAADLADGSSITRAFSWDNLLGMLQDTHEASVVAAGDSGTPVYFGIQTSLGLDNKPAFLFYTSTSQPGADRTGKTVLSFENGSVAEAEYVQDYSQEITVVYAGGQGTEDNRTISKQSSATRYNASRYNVREAFAWATMAETAAGVDAEAYKRLNEGRGREMLQITIQDSELVRYQLDWNVGDKISYDVLDVQGDEIVRSVGISVGPDGERLTTRLEQGALIGSPEERRDYELLKLKRALTRQYSREDTLYKGTGSAVPTTTELPNHGMYYLYDNGIARRAYYNLAGTIRNVTLT